MSWAAPGPWCRKLDQRPPFMGLRGGTRPPALLQIVAANTSVLAVSPSPCSVGECTERAKGCGKAPVSSSAQAGSPRCVFHPLSGRGTVFLAVFSLTDCG